MRSILGSDKVTKTYLNVPLELVASLKSLARGHEGIIVSATAMHRGLGTKRVVITSKRHSWYASNLAFGEFISSLPPRDVETLNMLRESSITS